MTSSGLSNQVQLNSIQFMSSHVKSQLGGDVNQSPSHPFSGNSPWIIPLEKTRTISVQPSSLLRVRPITSSWVNSRPSVGSLVPLRLLIGRTIQSLTRRTLHPRKRRRPLPVLHLPPFAPPLALQLFETQRGSPRIRLRPLSPLRPPCNAPLRPGLRPPLFSLTPPRPLHPLLPPIPQPQTFRPRLPLKKLLLSSPFHPHHAVSGPNRPDPPWFRPNRPQFSPSLLLFLPLLRLPLFLASSLTMPSSPSPFLSAPRTWLP